MAWESIGPNYSGVTHYLAATAAKWYNTWRAYMQQHHPDIKIVLIKGKAGGDSSAGTHLDGWAVDLRSWVNTPQQTKTLIAIARKFGGVAWLRTRDEGFDPHIHIAIDAGHWTKCQYQVHAAHAGYNGLGRGGRRGRDTSPAPARWVDAPTGLKMMEEELEEEDMAISEDQFKTWVKQAVSEMSWGNEKFGAYLGRIQAQSSDALYFARQAASQTAAIYRPNDPNADSQGQLSFRQEVASMRTEGQQRDDRLTSLEARLDRLEAGIESLLNSR